MKFIETKEVKRFINAIKTFHRGFPGFTLGYSDIDLISIGLS